ncbi:MAG TPA: helix-turn-helix domain-containing protein [Flavipsychrobacter sp.]
MKQYPSLEQLLSQLGSELYYQRHTTKQKLISVSKSVGVSHAVISRIENGRYEPLTLSLLKRLTDYYQIPLSLLFVSDNSDNAGVLLEHMRSEVDFLRESCRELLRVHNNNTVVGNI